MTRTFLLPLLLLVVTQTGQAQTTGTLKKVATSGMALLELPITPRMASRADARVMDLQGADALFGNPAGVAFGARHSTSLLASSTRWFADTQIHATAVSRQFGNVGTFGVSLAYLDYGRMQGAQNVGDSPTGQYELTGTFSAASLALGVTYARQFTDRFTFGITGRYARESISTYHAAAFGLDIGMLYETGLGSLRLGGLVQNFGQDASYIANPFRLPTTMRIASAYDVLPQTNALGRLTVQLEALHPNNGPEEIRAALEYQPLGVITLRGGYGFGRDEGGGAVGGSLDVLDGRLAVDASYADNGRLGPTLGVAVRAAF